MPAPHDWSLTTLEPPLKKSELEPYVLDLKLSERYVPATLTGSYAVWYLGLCTDLLGLLGG